MIEQGDICKRTIGLTLLQAEQSEAQPYYANDFFLYGRPAGRPATPMCHARGVTLENCFSQNRCFMKDIDLKLDPASSFDDMHPYLEFWREIRSKISKSRKNVFRAWQRDTPVTLSRPAGRSVGHPYMSRTKKNVFIRIDFLWKIST